jgi:eukaryotic-like serine/threonine-protein kinase
VPILLQLAEALAHAHRLDIVHRDLKPNNLILAERLGYKDFLKVLDFGLAKIVGDDNKQRVTIDGEILGTPEYMAPEQCIGDPVDARTDLYSIGCIAYELLTGKPPFTGRQADLIAMHTRDVPQPPSVRRPDGTVPHKLDLIVLRLLEKRRDRRFKSATDLHDALLEIPRGTIAKASRPRTQAKTILEMDRRSQELTAEGSSEAVRGIVRDLTRVVASQAGASPAVLAAYNELRRLEGEQQAIEVELVACEANLDEVEQEARERTSPLRMAVGELHFDRAQLRQSGARLGDLEFQIGELERRLAAVDADFRARRDSIVRRFGILTTGREAAIEAVVAHLHDIEGLVVDAAIRCGDPDASMLLGLLDDARRATSRSA